VREKRVVYPVHRRERKELYIRYIGAREDYSGELFNTPVSCLPVSCGKSDPVGCGKSDPVGCGKSRG
jgi:hypothetical protein